MCRRWGMFLACAVAVLVLAGCKAPGVPSLSLSIPSELMEGETADGMVTMSYASGLDTVIELQYSLTSGDGGQLSLPGGVILPAGSCSVTFTIKAVDDGIINTVNPATYSVSASFVGGTPVASNIDIYDAGS